MKREGLDWCYVGYMAFFLAATLAMFSGGYVVTGGAALASALFWFVGTGKLKKKK